MKFLFRILKNAFVQHLAAEGLEVVQRAHLDALKANQKRKRAANKNFAASYGKADLIKIENMTDRVNQANENGGL